MRQGYLSILLLVVVAACSPSVDPSGSEPIEVPSAAGATSSAPPAAGEHEAARYEALRHWSGTFHRAPDSLPAGNPGTLIRLESVAVDDTRRVYRSMYLSTGVDGETPVPVTGTIWVPAGDAPPEGFPIVAWGPGSNPHGMGEFGDGCVFSVRPIHPDTDHQDHFAQLLADGFVVSTTDYTGHGTQYPFVSVSETDTHALVDAARAARDLLGPAASARVIIAGFSTGGVAAAQSLLHLSPPAEDLDVRGVVSIEGFGDFTEIEPAQADEVGVHGDLRVVYLWTRAYPELRPEDVLTAEGLRLLDELHENGCVWFSQFDDVRRLDASIPEWRTVPAWDARIRAQTVMAAPVPTFYVVAEDNSRRDIIRAGAERLCETADHVAFQVYAGTDHYSVISAAYDDWAPWMKDRVSGDEPFDGCTF